MAVNKGLSSSILKAYYTDTSIITGFLNYGDVPTEAALDSLGVWQEFSCINSPSTINFAKEPFKITQYSSEILSDEVQKGLEKPEVLLEQNHTVGDTGFAKIHEGLIENSFGKKSGNSTGTTTIASKTSDSVIVLTAATNFAEGDIIVVKSATDVLKGKTEIIDLTTATITLKDEILGMVAGDKVTNVSYFDSRALSTDDKYYHLFLQTTIGNFFVLWCKPSMSIITTLNELTKISVKFLGDKTLKTTKVNTDLTVTAQVRVPLKTVNNFNRVIAGTDTCRNVVSAIFTITKDNVRIPSQCSVSGQGNGGCFNQAVAATLELTLNKYPESIASYEANTEISVTAYNESVMFSGYGLISNLKEFNEADKQLRPVLSIELNAIELKPLKVVL